MRTAHFTLVLASVSLVATAATAQVAPSRWDASGDAGWPCVGVGLATRTCTGDVTADGRVDAAYLINGVIYVADAPGSGGAILPTGFQATAIAHSPSTDPAVQSSLALIDAVGLHRLVWNQSTRAFDKVAVVTGSPRWTNAQRLVSRVDDNGVLHLANVNGDGRTVTVRLESGSSSVQLSTAFSSQIDALCLVNWDSDPDLEFAVVTQSHLRVRELDGSATVPAGNFALNRVGVASLTPIRAPGTNTERLAWLREAPVSGCEIAVVSATFPTEVVNLASGSTPPASISGVDAASAPGESFPGDGDTDLLVACVGFTAPVLYLNRPSDVSHAGNLFAANDFERLPGGIDQASAPAAADLAVADFDANGAQDVLFVSQILDPAPLPPASANGEIQVAFQVPYGAGLGVVCTSCLGSGVFKSASIQSGSGTDTWLDLSVQLDAMAVDATTAGYNALQILAWGEVPDTSATANAAHTTVTPLANQVYTFAPTFVQPGMDPEVARVQLFGNVPTSSQALAGIDCGFSAQNASRVDWIEARLVRLANPNLISSIPNLSGPTWVLFAANHHNALCPRATGDTGYLAVGGCDAVGAPSYPPNVCGLQGDGGANATPGMSATPSTYFSTGSRRRMAPGGNLSSTPVAPAAPALAVFQN